MESWDAHPGLARALDNIPGLDNAIKFEAAVLANGRHDAHAGGGGLDVVETRLAEGLQLHAR
jgi:hypothetical protein